MVRLLNFIRKSWCIKNNSTVACDYFNGGENSIMNARVGIDGRAAAAMVLLCAIWGMQQVAIKAAEQDVSAVLQIAIRSGLAALGVYLLARCRGECFTWDRATLSAGLSVGALFALEFFFVSEGLRYTSASHMAVFLYTAPLFSALGLHFLLPQERLSPVQWLGMLIAFGGVVLAISSMAEEVAEPIG